MIAVPVYDRAGQKVGEEQVDPADFGGEVNKQLLHDVVVMYQANKRVGTVNTRGRSDVAGSGKKLFRQKGTGNARAGAKRTNKRKGGGMAFARRNRDYRYALPKKAVRTAVRMALLSKFQDGQVAIIDGLTQRPTEKPKTKDVAAVLQAVVRPDAHEQSTDAGASKIQGRRRMLGAGSVLIGLAAPDRSFYLSARNLENVMVAPVTEFNTHDVLKQRYLVLSREALTALKERVKEPVRRKPAPEVADARTGVAGRA